MTQLKDDDGAVYEIIDSDGEDNESLNGILGELGLDGVDDIMLKVYRVDAMGKDAHIFDCLPDALNGIEDRLRDSYGKGDYKIKVFTPTPKGGKSVKKTVKMAIEVPLNNNEVEKPLDNSGDLKSVVSDMMAAMQNSQKEMFSMMQNNSLVMANKNQEMIIAILSNKKDDKPEVGIVEQLALLKQIIPEPTNPMDMLNSMMDMHKSVKDEFSGSNENSVMGELTQGLNSLVSLAANAPQKNAEPAPQTTPSVGEIKQNPGQPESGSDMNPIIKHKLNRHLAFLIEKAKQGKDPELWVEVTLDEVPDNYYPLLVDNLGANDDEAFLNMAKINPDIVNFKPWFIDFCRIMRDAFSEADDVIADKKIPDLTDDAKLVQNDPIEFTNSDVDIAIKQQPNNDDDNRDT